MGRPDATGHRRRSRKAELVGVLLVALALMSLSQLAFESTPVFGFNQSANNRNVSVDTRVNITGSAPEILSVSIQNPITLGAGAITSVTCNLSIRDYNGFGDIIAVNATLWHTTLSSFSAADDNSTHYSNSSCVVIGSEASGSYANYTCSFGVNYYATNGTWNCTAIVNDSINLRNNNSNLTNISALIALNVTTLIDYGDMAMGDTSSNVEANVSNMGNYPINVTVRGYGRTLDDGWGFICEQGNLTVNLQHFASNATATYGQKQVLGSAYTRVNGLTIEKPTNANGTLNTTYWQLYLDPLQNAFGLCNGTIVFQAENFLG